MAYETGSATDLEDLVGKLSTFLQGATAAWTEDEYDTGNNWATLHKSNVWVSFRWDDSPGTDLGVYQSLGWTDTMAPHQQDDDSGNGDTTTPINAERRCNLESAGPYTAYYFFASDSAPWYCHCVVEPASGRYRHFGFGELVKHGDWTGGEYCYAHFWDQSIAQIDLPNSTLHQIGLDATGSSNNACATIHAEGLADQGVNEKWLAVTGSSSGGTDTATEIRLRATGSWRGGMYAYYLAWIAASQLNAYKPLAPVQCFYKNTVTTPDTIWSLGSQPDVAILNIRHLNPADEITIGSDTWTVFPWVRKQFNWPDDNTEESWNAGVAYKKIV